MRANATRVACATLDTDPCAYRVVAEHLPDVAVFVFDRDLCSERAPGAAVTERRRAERELRKRRRQLAEAGR